MNISSLQENLKHGLLAISSASGKNINLPILNNVLIEAEKGNIKLTATNLEIGVVHTVRGKVDEDGVFTVEAKLLSDYVSLLPNKKINIKQKNNNLFIETEGYKTKITGQSAEDFPLIPVVQKEEFYSAKIVDFKKAVSQIVFAVSSSETRIELSGVLFNFNNSKLTLAATDSYRLAEKEINIQSNTKNEDKKVIVPAKTLQEIVRILSNIKEESEMDDKAKEIKFYLSDNQILFEIGATELVSRLIEGQYPDYKQIIPNSTKTEAVITRTDLIRAVKTSALFSKTGINDVNLDFPSEKNQIIISSASGQTGENIAELSAKVSGQDNGVVINYRYLLDGLNNIEGENVKIEITDSNTPCILKGEHGEGYLYVIMPIKQ